MIDVAANPPDAAEVALNKFGNDILRLAYSYLKTREDAEDVVQDTLIKFMQAGGKYETEEKMKSWLLQVAANLCRDLLKSAARKKQVALPEDYDPPAEESSGGGTPDPDNEVMEAVMSLPEKYRSVIHLYYMEEYSIKEIAEILEKRESTVKSLLKRGRERLAKKLEEGDGGYAGRI